MADEPAFLSKGMEVSAKYRGAFCEAKVTHVEKNVRCKVFLKEECKSMIVSDDDIRGNLKVGCRVDVHKSDSTRYLDAVITRITDLSLYTVVFDDGDEETLRRGKLNMKGNRHFMRSETLDDLPLTNPEQFSTPVIRKSAAVKHSKSNAESGSESDDEDSMSDESVNDDGDGNRNLPSKPTASSLPYSKALQDLVGQVVCIDVEERGKKMVSLPVLVVVPTADELALTSSDHFLVRSFKDNRFMSSTLDAAKMFAPAAAAAKTTTYKDKVYKCAWDKAQQYVDQQELPALWDRTQLLGSRDNLDRDELMADSERIIDERRDWYVAQLYNFMDDRGTPINRAPTLASSDVDLFHLHRLVASMGGYNKVNNLSRWSTVFVRMKLHSLMPISAGTKQIKDCYEKYIHPYEDMKRKLGFLLSGQDRAPPRYTQSRSLLSFRDVPTKLLMGRGGTPARRPSSLKDDFAAESKPSTDVKEEASADADDTDKSDASVQKTDDFTRSTRKTPKRLLPSVISTKPHTAVTDTKGTDESSGPHTRSPAESKDSRDSVAAEKKVTSAKPKATRQRMMDSDKLAKSNVSKMKPGGSVGGLSKKTSTTDDRTEKKPPGRPPAGSKGDEKFVKKKTLLEKKPAAAAIQVDVKRTMNLVVEKVDTNRDDKSSAQKRPMRRVPATEGSSKSVASDVSASSRADMDSAGHDEGKGSRIGSADEVLVIGTRLQVKYGKGTNLRAYEAKVIDVRNAANASSVEYRVHYAGWNNRYDEWIKSDAISSVIDAPAADAAIPASSKHKQPATVSSAAASVKKKASGSVLTTPVALPGRQKRLASASDTSKSALKPQAAKIPRRRTRTRSRTHDAAADSADSESTSSSVSASDAEQAESTGRRPSVSASAADSQQQTSTAAAVSEQHDLSQSSDNVTPVNSQLETSDSPADETMLALSKSEFGAQSGLEHHEGSRAVSTDKQAGLTDACTAEGSSKPSTTTTSTEGIESKKDSDTSRPSAADKEAVLTVDSPVKTRGKSRISSRSVSSNVDASADLEGFGVEVDDKTKTSRVKKKCSDEDSTDKTEKKARKQTKEDKAADDECSNEEEARVTGKMKEEETSQKSRVTGLKEKDRKQESESDDQKGKAKDSTDHKAQKSHSTRKGSMSMTSDPAGREKRSRVPIDKTDSSEVVERGVGRGRRKVKVGPSDIILSEAENSQEAEQYGISESGDSASTKFDSNTVKQVESVESSSFEGSSEADEFAGKITETGEADLSVKVPCLKDDICENLSEMADSGATAHVEHMSRADVASLLTAAFTDSPAYTSADELGPAGGSSSSSAEGTSSLSPAADADEEHTSTKSELEANMEVAAYMGGGSTNEAELSSDEDDDDDDSSLLNTLSRKPSAKTTMKRKSDDGSFQHSGKRRRREKQHRTRSQHTSSATKAYSYRNDDASDSDDNELTTHAAKPTADVTAASNFPIKLHGARINVKYNFLDLKEGQFLEGEERIAFLMSKIQDLRRVYMNLKAEVACIDRRRRRHRIKEREAQQQANAGSLPLVPAATSS